MSEWPEHCFKAYDIRGLSGTDLTKNSLSDSEKHLLLTSQAKKSLLAETLETLLLTWLVD